MVALRRFRNPGPSFADLVPYAGLVDDGVILLKDGSLMAGWYFAGPDSESSTNQERNEVSRQINGVLAKLGSGWMIQVEAVRVPTTAYPPALASFFPDAVTRAIERSGLLVCDIEILRLHYAETLKAWRERFMARREEAVQLYDERFARMWEFYLAASEMSFRKQNLMNFQIQLTKRQGVVPMTRDYLASEEAKLRRFEIGKKPRLQIAGE